MDCYIVRVYRHITHKNGQADEIAGLVERVGNEDSGRPFTTYRGLIEAMREGFTSKTAGDAEQAGDKTGVAKRIRAARGR